MLRFRPAREAISQPVSSLAEGQAAIDQENLSLFVTAVRAARRHSSLPALVFFVTRQIVPGPLKVIVARRPVRFPSQQVVGVSVRDKYSSTS
jgi:hypothetical protein